MYYTVERVRLMNDITEMMQGVLEGCVLEIISRQETYGYEITKKLNEMGFEDVVEGTVYTILVRLEKNKLVDVQRRPSKVGPSRKFFHLNEAGRRELEAFWQRWDFVSSRIRELEDKRDVSI